MRAADLSRALRPIKNAIANMLARAVVSAADDSKKSQELKLEVGKDEVREALERPQQYGFTSVPLDGAEAFVAFIGGRRDHGVVLAVEDRRYRIKGLEKGEVAIYTDEGDKLVFKRGGTIEVTCSTKFKVNAPLVETSSNMKVGGNLEVVGTSALKGATTVGTGPAHANLTVNGNATATGTVTGTTEVVGGGKNLSSHTHSAGSFQTIDTSTSSPETVTGTSGAPT